jgi:DUF1009 family protein
MTAGADLPRRSASLQGAGAAVFGRDSSRAPPPFLFAIRGFCDPVRVAGYPHHWVALGQVGRLTRLMRAEGCRDIVFIGGLVRPALFGNPS